MIALVRGCLRRLNQEFLDEACRMLPVDHAAEREKRREGEDGKNESK